MTKMVCPECRGFTEDSLHDGFCPIDGAELEPKWSAAAQAVIDDVEHEVEFHAGRENED